MSFHSGTRPWTDGGPCGVPRALAAVFFLPLLSWGQDAQPQMFVISRELSTLTLGGEVLGVPILEQGPGSLTSRLTGTVVAKVGGSQIEFLDQSYTSSEITRVWQPKACGLPGAEKASFGGVSRALFSTVYGTFRDIELSLSSDVLGLTEGHFSCQVFCSRDLSSWTPAGDRLVASTNSASWATNLISEAQFYRVAP